MLVSSWGLRSALYSPFLLLLLMTWTKSGTFRRQIKVLICLRLYYDADSCWRWSGRVFPLYPLRVCSALPVSRKPRLSLDSTVLSCLSFELEHNQCPIGQPRQSNQLKGSTDKDNDGMYFSYYAQIQLKFLLLASKVHVSVLHICLLCHTGNNLKIKHTLTGLTVELSNFFFHLLTLYILLLCIQGRDTVLFTSPLLKTDLTEM